MCGTDMYQQETKDTGPFSRSYLFPEGQVATLYQGRKSEDMTRNEEGCYDDGTEDEPHVGDGMKIVQRRAGVEGSLQ